MTICDKCEKYINRFIFCSDFGQHDLRKFVNHMSEVTKTNQCDKAEIISLRIRTKQP